MDWLTERLEGNRKILDELLSAPKLPFDESLRSRLPERPGLYAICIKDAQPGEFLRAGRTRCGGGQSASSSVCFAPNTVTDKCWL